MNSLVESASGEERIGYNETRQLLQFLAITLDDSYVVVCQHHVALFQLKVSRCLMGMKYHAVMAVNVYKV
jgi:hypothetical protein